MPNSTPLRTGAHAATDPVGREGPVGILVVDDDEAVRRSLILLLRANGYRVHGYASGPELLRQTLPPDADILIVDYVMPGMDGLTLVQRLRAQGWPGTAVLITGRYENGLAERASADGVIAVLDKPVDKHALLSILQRQRA